MLPTKFSLSLTTGAGTSGSFVSRWGSPSYADPTALSLPVLWCYCPVLLLVMTVRVGISLTVSGTKTSSVHVCGILTAWRLNLTPFDSEGPGSQELGSKKAYFSQGSCYQRKSMSSCPEFLGHSIRTLPLYPHQGLGIFTFPCKHKTEQPKSPGLLEKGCSGAIPQSARAVSWPSLMLRQSALFKQKAFWLESVP